MNFKRKIYKELESWKDSDNRKPLLLRGARQVGKTTLVKDFSQTYPHSITLNLERSTDIRYFTNFIIRFKVHLFTI